MNEADQKALIPMTLGESLRNAREKRGLGIEQLADEIRVKPAILLAIEANETGHIPRVYLKGYIRTYARRLGIRPDEVENRMREAPCTEPPVQSVFSEALPRNRSERWFKATSYLLASAVVIALVWQFTTEAVRFSQGESLPRAATVDPASPGGSRSTEGASGERAEAPAIAPAPAKLHLRASIASVETARSTRDGGQRSVAEGAWAAVGNRSASTEAAPSSGTGDAVLSIATSADSWVEIFDGNGERIEMDLFRAGNRRHYTGAEPFRLLLGRASSIELTYNGKPVDLAPHTRGNVARVTLGGDSTDVPPALEPDSDAAPIPNDREGTREQG